MVNQTLFTIGVLLQAISMPVNIYSICIGLGFLQSEYYNIIAISGFAILVTGLYITHASRDDEE